MRHQEIIFGLAGQSFFYDPPEGRPSGTPTVQVFLASNDDDGPVETATTGAASLSVNTTLSAAASAGDTQVSVVSGSGVTRGRRFLVTDADVDRELIEVASITGTTVGLRRPLQNSYASGSTFVGTRISISVNATWVADRSKISDSLGASWRKDTAYDASVYAGHGGYRLRWSYTVDGVATIGISFADLVRYASKNLITALDIDGRFPGFIDRLPPDHQRDQGAALVDDCFHAVRMDLLGDAHTARKIRDTDILGELTMHKAVVMAAVLNVLAGRGDPAAVREAEKLYEQRYNQLAREPKFPVDPAGGGASAQAKRLPLWRR